ncbi:MAG: mechanosensitive ion channel [Clostridia bacterium]|nr:mechanosensitive ion channel [Clostridia bacterium]
MYLSLFTEESAQALSSADETASLAANAEQSLSTIQKWLTSGYNWFISYLPNLISGLIIFVVGWWLTKLLCKLLLKAMTKGKADPTVATFLHSIINLALKTIVIICVLSTVGFDVTTIITTLGAAAVTIGLALKDSLSNVASGTLIILNKKFKIGDYLETEGLKGVVKKIDMMYTTLCTYDNKEVLIPNSRLTSNNIVNYFVQEERRIDLIIPISYSEDIDKARKVIMELIRHDDRVIQEKRNRVAVDKLNESSVDLSVWIWCRSADYWLLLEDMMESIKKSFDAHNITIPFNQLDIHLDEGVSLPTLPEKH